MAQATKSSNRKGSSGRSGQAKRASRSAATRASGPAGAVGDAIAARRAAVAGTRAAGRAAAAAARQGKTQLVLGGAALAGVAGIAIKNRSSARRPRRRNRLVDAVRPLRDVELDLEAVASAARRLSAFSARVADVATATEEFGKPTSRRRQD